MLGADHRAWVSCIATIMLPCLGVESLELAAERKIFRQIRVHTYFIAKNRPVWKKRSLSHSSAVKVTVMGDRVPFRHLVSGNQNSAMRVSRRYAKDVAFVNGSS